MRELLGIFYPRLCCGCNAALMKNERFICTQCMLNLPKTNYHKQPGNPLEKVFWGRVPLQHAYSYVHFRKGSTVQKLLHELKYKGNKELGEYLGMLMGQTITESGASVDAVVAVPLHKTKERKRGYNQAACIARGLAEHLGVPDLSPSLQRKRFTETQTKKGRFERWENVEDVFVMSKPEELMNRHILLVDDVITTGATIEACAHSLLKAEGCRLSVASIAVAVK